MSYLYVYSPCCCSSNWQKMVKTNFCFTILLRTFFIQKKIKFLLFGRIFLFFFLFSSIQEKHFCEQTPVLLVFRFVSLSLFEDSSVFLKRISRNFCVLLYSSFSQPFFVTFTWSPSSWTLFLYLHFLHFLEQQSPLCIKKLFNFHFSHACVTSVCPFAHTFVHLLYLFLSSFFLVSYTFVSLFLLLFSLSITSLKDKLKELLQIWKKTCLSIYLFVGHFFQIYLSLHNASWWTRLHIQWDMWCPSFLLYFLFL